MKKCLHFVDDLQPLQIDPLPARATSENRLLTRGP